MKLKTIASIFRKNKNITIFTTEDGEQWIGNGAVMYSMSGLPYMTPEIILRIFDVPPDKHNTWICNESEMPKVVNYSDSTNNESEAEPLKINIEWFGTNYWLFPDGRRIYSINEDYIKPLLDESDYLTYYKRETINGGFVLACKTGLILKAIICPNMLHNNEDYTDEIKKITALYREMEYENAVNSAYEIFGKMTQDTDQGETEESDGQEEI